MNTKNSFLLKRKEVFFLFFFLTLLFLITNVNAAVTIGTTSGSGVKIIDKVVASIGSFLGLSDTPDTYAGSGNFCVKVNAGATALEFVACGGGGDFSFTDFQDSFNLNATELQYNFNQSNLKYEFNQSNLLYNFNQSAITYNFNQSNLDSVYTSLGTVQIVNNTIFFLNTTYSQFWFNQSDLDSVYAKVGEGGNVSWNETYAGELFVNITGDTMTGSLRFTNADLYFGGTAQGIYFNDTLDNAEFRTYSSTNIRMGFPSNRGANLEFYHMNDTTQPGNLIFVYGGNKSIGNVYFKQYNGSDWNNNFQLDTYGNLNILSNITSTYFIGNGSQLTGIQYNFNQTDLTYNFNQSDLTFNFNQSDLTFNFNQSNLDSVYTSLGTLQIINDSVTFLNTTYNEWWFNQSDLKYNFNQSELDLIYLKAGNYITNDSNANLTNLNVTGVLNVKGVQINSTWLFNQSNFVWQSTYNATYDTRITSVNSTVFFLNTTYSQWWFNQTVGFDKARWNLSSTDLFLETKEYDVGMGTTTPFAKLDVRGDAGTLGVDAPSTFNVTGGAGYGSGATGTKGGEIQLKSGTGGGATPGNGANGGGIYFITGNGGTGTGGTSGNGGDIILRTGIGGTGGLQGDFLVNSRFVNISGSFLNINGSSMGLGIAKPTSILHLMGQSATITLNSTINGHRIEIGYASAAGGDPTISLMTAGITSGRIFQRQNATNDTYIGDVDNNRGDLYLRTSGTNALQINASQDTTFYGNVNVTRIFSGGNGAETNKGPVFGSDGMDTALDTGNELCASQKMTCSFVLWDDVASAPPVIVFRGLCATDYNRNITAMCY